MYASNTIPRGASTTRVITASRSGVLARVANRQIGLLFGEAGGARRAVGAELDRGVAMRYVARVGRAVSAGEEIARLYLRREDPDLVRRFAECFVVADAAVAPPLVVERIGAAAA